MKEIWLKVGGRYSFSFGAWLVLSPVSILGTAGFIPEGLAPGSSIWLGFLVGFIGHAATGLFLLLGYLTYLSPRPDRKPRPLAAVSTLAVAGVARGLSVSWSLEFFGLVEAAEYIPRMSSGAILVVIWFSVAAVLVGARREYIEVYNRLAESLDRESLLASQGAQAVAKTRADLVEQVKRTLSEAFSSRSSTTELHNLADSVIRPLSHSLSSHQELVVNPVSPKRRINLIPVVRTALYRFPFNPAPVAAIGLLSTLYGRVWNIGWIGFLETVIQAGVIFGLFGLAKKYRIRGALVPFVWLGVGLSANLISWLVLGYDLSAALATALWLSAAIILPASFVSLFFAYEFERAKNIQILEEALNSVHWLERKLNQQLWIEKKRLARYVHSDIQGRVRAAALSNTVGTMADVQNLQQQCIEALDLSRELPSFDRFYSDTVALWDGVANISLDANPAALKALEIDSFGLASVVEVIREGVGNAVRHAKAKNIEVGLALVAQENPCLEVVVINDGEPRSTDSPAGFGSRTIGEVSSSWGLEGQLGKTKLWAKVPVSSAE